MAIAFRYKQIERPAPLEPMHAPVISITLHGKEVLETAGLIDSGADSTAIPRTIAEILGLDLSGPQDEVIGVGGRTKAVERNVSITVRNAHEKYTFEMPVKIILTEMDFPILLGRRGFFDQFDILFKENERKVLLKKVAPVEKR